MRASSSVCADSSLLVKLVLPEEDSAAARTLWIRWANEGISVYAPFLILYEFVSAIRQRVRRADLRPERGADALATLVSLDLLLIASPDLHQSAYKLAVDLNVQSAYDAHYLALTQEFRCEFWTADARLYRAVSDRFPLMRLLGG